MAEAVIMTTVAVRPPLGCLGRGRYVRQMRPATTGIVLVLGVGVVVEGAECRQAGIRTTVPGPFGQTLRYRRITVAGVTGTAAGAEGTASGIVWVAAETAFVRMPGFSNACPVVLGLGVTNLAKTAIREGVNHCRRVVCKADSPGRRVKISYLCPDHRKIGSTVELMTLPALHGLRATLYLEVGAHVAEPDSRHLNRIIVAESTFGIQWASQ